MSVQVGTGYRREVDRLQVVKDYLAALAHGNVAEAQRIREANPEIKVWP